MKRDKITRLTIWIIVAIACGVALLLLIVKDRPTVRDEIYPTAFDKQEWLMQIERDSIINFTWHGCFDTVSNHEFLRRGYLIDSVSNFPGLLIDLLNMRPGESKIKFAGASHDTIIIKILNDHYLTERMGSSGAILYLGETVFTLTESGLFNHVRLLVEQGSHAGPGVFSRDDFGYLFKR